MPRVCIRSNQSWADALSRRMRSGQLRGTAPAARMIGPRVLNADCVRSGQACVVSQALFRLGCTVCVARKHVRKLRCSSIPSCQGNASYILNTCIYCLLSLTYAHPSSMSLFQDPGSYVEIVYCRIRQRCRRGLFARPIF